METSIWSHENYWKLYPQNENGYLKFSWKSITVNPFYNHAHFSHILVYVTHFLVTMHFSKKHHFLESLSHSLVAQNICKVLFKNVIKWRNSKTNIRVL